MTKNEAVELGYAALTTPYNQKPDSIEAPWFESTMKDLAGCDCVLVEFSSGIEIWRHQRELNVDPNGIRVHFIDRKPRYKKAQ